MLLVLLEVSGRRIELQQSVDGLGGTPCGFRQAFGRSARGSGQHAFHFLGGKDFEDAADQRRFADARPARDDEQLVLARLPNGFLLGHRQLDAQSLFDPGNRLFDVDAGQGMRTGRGDAKDRLGQSDLGPMKTGQIKPRLAINIFSNDAPILNGSLDRRFHDLCVDLHQLGRLLDDARVREAAVSVTGQFLQGEQDGGSRPVGAIAVDSQRRRQFVGGLEADSPNVVRQLIRIRFDLGDGFVPVGAVDADGSPRRDAMLGQEEHELADFFLLLPALADSLEPLRPDPFDMQQEVGGLLEDLQRSLVIDGDDLGRQFRADTADRPRGKILFDAFG